MAAGKGTRMNDPSRAKVMYPVGGVPMIDHVVQRAVDIHAERIIVILGHQRRTAEAHLQESFPNQLTFVYQDQQLGTGHAVIQAAPQLHGYAGDVLILSGDVPLISSQTLGELLSTHRTNHPAATVLSVTMPDPSGYGRIIRDANNDIAAIVEHKDATDEQRAIREINSGIYVFRAPALLDALAHLDNNNAQGEYYLTDAVQWLRSQGQRVMPYMTANAREVQGINTPQQLAEADTEFLSNSAL